jgi:hypothetical protein
MLTVYRDNQVELRRLLFRDSRNWLVMTGLSTGLLAFCSICSPFAR